jgi:hypothetical protein
MAFFIGQGDTVQLNYIVKTLNAKLYAIDGVTTNSEVKIPNAEVVNYWVKSKGTATKSTAPGAKQNFTEKALIKKSVTVDQSEQINGVIPGVNIATVSADAVNAYVVEDTIEAANAINRDYLTKLEAKASPATTTFDADEIYKCILDLRAEFIKENKANHIVPTAMFVSPEAMARLKEKNLIIYKDNSPYGSFLEMEIIEAPDLTVNGVIMNQMAMVSGVAFNAVKTFDGSYLGYADGVAYIGEIAYVNKATEMSDDFTGKLVLKF